MNPDTCHTQGAGESYKDWLQRLQTQLNETIKNHTRLQGLCGNASSAVTEQEAICGNLTAELNATKATCDRTQAELEETTCSIVTTSNLTCNAYKTCVASAQEALQAQLPSAEAAAENRKAEYRAFSRMLCLIDVLIPGATHDQIEVCRAKVHNADHLDLDHSKAPNNIDPDGHPACSPLTPTPCCAAYLTEEYHGLPENVHAQACSVCPQVASLPNTTNETPLTLMASVATGTESLHGRDQAWDALLGQLHDMLHRPGGQVL